MGTPKILPPKNPRDIQLADIDLLINQFGIVVDKAFPGNTNWERNAASEMNKRISALREMRKEYAKEKREITDPSVKENYRNILLQIWNISYDLSDGLEYLSDNPIDMYAKQAGALRLGTENNPSPLATRFNDLMVGLDPFPIPERKSQFPRMMSAFTAKLSNFLKFFFGPIRYVPGPTVPPNLSSPPEKPDESSDDKLPKLIFKVDPKTSRSDPENIDRTFALGNVADLYNLINNLKKALQDLKLNQLAVIDPKKLFESNLEADQKYITLKITTPIMSDFTLHTSDNPPNGRVATPLINKGKQEKASNGEIVDKAIQVLDKLREKLSSMQSDAEDKLGKFDENNFKKKCHAILDDLQVLGNCLGIQAFQLDKNTLLKLLDGDSKFLRLSPIQILYIRLKEQSNYKEKDSTAVVDKRLGINPSPQKNEHSQVSSVQHDSDGKKEKEEIRQEPSETSAKNSKRFQSY